MDVSIASTAKISRFYQNQERIADLNKKAAGRKTFQGQVDRVSISEEARAALQLSQFHHQGAATENPSRQQPPSEPAPNTQENSGFTPLTDLVGGGQTQPSQAGENLPVDEILKRVGT